MATLHQLVIKFRTEYEAGEARLVGDVEFWHDCETYEMRALAAAFYKGRDRCLQTLREEANSIDDAIKAMDRNDG